MTRKVAVKSSIEDMCNYLLSVIFAQTAQKETNFCSKINLKNDKTPFSFNTDSSHKPNS